MRRAVRRLTWILLSLALMTVLCFALLSELVTARGGGAALPRFFNAAPRNVRDLTHEALERLGRGADDRAATELARLGGAALPYVLPNLERLEVPARERVALALAPVAVRMGAAREEELTTGPVAVSFWLRFWQDRSIDFRDTVVRRLVTRLGERSLALRREDVLALDTFALPHLIKALRPAKNDEDVKRLRRITTVLSHVAGEPLTLERDASAAQANVIVRRWRAWWEEHGADFTALDGPTRIAAMIKETSYGRWLASVLRGELGRTNDDRTGLELLRSAAPRTALLLAVVTVLGTLLGAACAALVPRWRGVLPSAANHLAAALAAFAMLASATALGSTWLGAGTLLVLAQAALIVSHAPPRGDQRPKLLAAEIAAASSVVATQAPLLASLALAAEVALSERGLGRELKHAFARADLHALMAITLCCALVAALVMVVADALHAWLWSREAAEEP